MSRGFGPDVDRVVVIRDGDGGRRRVREIYNEDNSYDDDDDEIHVRVLKRTGSGRLRSVDWDSNDGRRKKSSRMLRPIERTLRRAARRQARLANIYLNLHDRSSRRKRNGWAKDLGRNVIKTYRRGLKLRFL